MLPPSDNQGHYSIWETDVPVPTRSTTPGINQQSGVHPYKCMSVTTSIGFWPLESGNSTDSSINLGSTGCTANRATAPDSHVLPEGELGGNVLPGHIRSQKPITVYPRRSSGFHTHGIKGYYGIGFLPNTRLSYPQSLAVGTLVGHHHEMSSLARRDWLPNRG